MNKKKTENRPVNYMMVLAGIALIYLAVKMLRDVEQVDSLFLGIAIAVAFALIGAWLLLTELRVYLRSRKAQPETGEEALPETGEAAPQEDET